MKPRAKKGMIALPLLVVALLGYLVLDDFHLEENTDIHARVPTCEESAANFHALSRLLKKNVGSFERKFLKDVRELEGEDRRVRLLENRELIRANYAAHAPHRALIRQIVETGRIGDPSVNVASETLKFQNFRPLLFAVCLHAELSVADPETDDDLEDLLALYEAMLNWAPHTRILVHLLISFVAIDAMQTSLAAIHAESGEEGWAPGMSAVLSRPHDFVEAASRVAWTEYCIAAVSLDEIVSAQNFSSRLVLNRNRTLNLYAAFIREQNELAAEGRWEELAVLTDGLANGLETSRIKNSVGRTFLAMAIPAMSRVFEQAHKIEAQRTALLATE